MTRPRYAIIHVKPNPSSDAWPIVERVPAILGGGWQSGAHHYRDSEVLDFRPLMLVDATDMSVADLAAEAMAAHSINMSDVDVDNNAACVCGQWRGGDPSVDPGWDGHLAEVLAEAGLLVDLEKAAKLHAIVRDLDADGLDRLDLTSRQRDAIGRLRELAVDAGGVR